MVRPSGHNGKRRFYEAPFSIFKVSGRLFASNKHAPACLFRQSPNANGSAESRSALGFLWSRQQCSRRAAALHRFLGLSLRSAHSRRASTEGRSVGEALPHFHSEPYVTLHPRRGFAYIRRCALLTADTYTATGVYKKIAALAPLLSFICEGAGDDGMKSSMRTGFACEVK